MDSTHSKYYNLNSYFHLSKYFKSDKEVLKILITNKNIKNKEDYYSKNSENIKDLSDFDNLF